MFAASLKNGGLSSEVLTFLNSLGDFLRDVVSFQTIGYLSDDRFLNTASLGM